VRPPQVKAVEEVAVAVRVLDFQESPPWLVGLEREGPSGGGGACGGGRLRGSERDCRGGTNWAVGDNQMGAWCQWQG
jgi:hypothetical protein